MNWQILDPQNNPLPVTEQQIRALVGQGIIKRSTLMWCDGMDDWQPASAARPDIFPAVAAAAPAPPPRLAPQVAAPPPIPVYGQAPRLVREQKKKSSAGLILKVGIAAVVVIAAASFFLGGSSGGESSYSYPGGGELRKAEGLMSGDETKGFGATEAERTAAQQAAVVCATLREEAITKSSGSSGRGKSGLLRRAAAAVDGKGMTAVCSVQGKCAVFLFHVPGLRKFDDEAKAVMGDIAWLAARQGWQTLREPRPERIIAGIKGIVAYDRAMEGPASGEEPRETITSTSDATRRLAACFVKVEAPAAAVKKELAAPKGSEAGAEKSEQPAGK